MSKCDQIRCFLRIWSHSMEKSLMENFIFLYSYLFKEALFTSWRQFVCKEPFHQKISIKFVVKKKHFLFISYSSVFFVNFEQVFLCRYYYFIKLCSDFPGIYHLYYSTRYIRPIRPKLEQPKIIKVSHL